MQTREKTFGITCPSCGNTFEESLNTAIFSSTLDRQMILKNEFGKIICPKCGHEFILNYKFVYTDEDIKFMLVNDPKFTDFKFRLAFISSLELLDKSRKDEQEKFLTRMCTDIEEVREKIIIFENYLSDKAIELLKYILLESEELEFNHDDVSSFRLVDKDKFLIKTASGEEYTLAFVREVYEKLLQQYKGMFDANKVEKIDKTWAYEFLKKHK